MRKFQDVWDGIHKIEIQEWQETVKSAAKFVNQMSIYVFWLYFIVGSSYELVALWISMKRQLYGESGDMFYGIHAK